MRITRTSIMTGITRTMELPISVEQIIQWQAGTVAQVAFAHLSPSDREFLISGIVQSEWDTLTSTTREV